MPQLEVAIVGKNNTKAAVTGQNELLVKVSDGSSTALATEIASAIIAAETAESIMVVSVPTVATVPVTAWDASVDFLSDAIAFDKNATFAVQIVSNNIVGGLPKLTIFVSLNNVDYGTFSGASTDMDMLSNDFQFNYDSVSPFTSMKIGYVSASSTGSFSLLLAK